MKTAQLRPKSAQLPARTATPEELADEDARHRRAVEAERRRREAAALPPDLRRTVETPALTDAQLMDEWQAANAEGVRS